MKARILIVDDEIASRRPCAISLKNEGYEVVEAESGEEALELFKAQSFNLVLTDLKMQGIDGIEVLKQVKSIDSDCAVIIMTAYTGVETGVSAIKLGAYDYFVKPVRIDELNLKINRCLKEKKLSKKIKELDEIVVLYKISKVMHSTRKIEMILKIIVDSTLEVLNADTVSLMLLNEKGKLYIAVSNGLDRKVQKEIELSVGEGVAGYVAKEKEPLLIIGEIQNDPRFKNIVGQKEIKSSLVVPLIAKSGLLGVININRRNSSEDFIESDLHRAVIFASQITSAIENANLFRKLEEEKEKIEVMFSGMGDGSIITDGQLNIIMVNRAAKRLLNIDEKNCRGKDFLSVVSDFEVSPWKKTEEKIITFDLIRKKGKPLFLSVLITKIKSQDEVVGHILILRDVTEERKESMLKKTFIATISHKLRTPLTGIISAVAILRSSERQKDEMEKKAIDIAEKQGWHLSELLNKLIRFTMLETGSLNLDRKEIKINSIIKYSLDNLSPTIKENNVKVEVLNSIDEVPLVFVDHEKIQEVFENLIENAIKFNGKKEKEVYIAAYPEGDEFIKVEIVDNGVGIPSEEQEKIFQKFYQIEEFFTGEVKGAGIGLSVAKKIIEAHNGKIRVESKIGKGSKFIFGLPVYSPRSVTAESFGAREGDLQGEKRGR